MITTFRTFCIGLATFGLLSSALASEKPAASEVNPTSGKSYQIRNKKFGGLLRPQDANSADGTPIVLYPAQAWKCMTWKLNSAGASQFSLQNHFTSKTFSAKSSGERQATAVIQVPFVKNTSERPSWQFSRLKNGSYKIVESATGKALSAQKRASDSEVKAVLEALNESDSQEWELVEIDPAKITM